MLVLPDLTICLQGIFQLKYLYAEHMYGWGAEQVRPAMIV